jgi:hypothetical protein
MVRAAFSRVESRVIMGLSIRATLIYGVGGSSNDWFDAYTVEEEASEEWREVSERLGVEWHRFGWEGQAYVILGISDSIESRSMPGGEIDVTPDIPEWNKCLRDAVDVLSETHTFPVEETLPCWYLGLYADH